MNENETPKYGTPEWDAYVASERERLQAATGKRVYSTDEVTQEFEIEYFAALMAYGTRKSTGAKVVLDFQSSPRFYWVYKED